MSKPCVQRVYILKTREESKIIKRESEEAIKNAGIDGATISQPPPPPPQKIVNKVPDHIVRDLENTKVKRDFLFFYP